MRDEILEILRKIPDGKIKNYKKIDYETDYIVISRKEYHLEIEIFADGSIGKKKKDKYYEVQSIGDIWEYLTREQQKFLSFHLDIFSGEVLK